LTLLSWFSQTIDVVYVLKRQGRPSLGFRRQIANFIMNKLPKTLFVTVNLMYVVKKDYDSFTLIIDTIGVSSAIYFIEATVLLITLMSSERWLYLSRRSLVTSQRGCLTVITILIVTTPTVVLRVLPNDKHSYDNRMRLAIIAAMLTCYLTTSFAHFKVYRIIRHHQQQVQANEASQNYAQQAINLAKYKQSVTTMLFIIALLSFCFIPYVCKTIKMQARYKFPAIFIPCNNG